MFPDVCEHSLIPRFFYHRKTSSVFLTVVAEFIHAVFVVKAFEYLLTSKVRAMMKLDVLGVSSVVKKIVFRLGIRYPNRMC